MAGNYNVKYVFEAVDNMSRALKDIKTNLKSMEGGMQSAEIKARSFSDKMKSAGEGFSKFGSKMKWVSAGITAAGVASVYAFSKMEKGLMNVQGLMSTDEVNTYTEDLKKLQTEALRDGFTIEDLNKGLFDTISALGSGNQAFETFRTGQILAKGGAAELRVALDGMTSVINAYGRDVTNATEVANAFYTAQVYGKTTVADLASNVGKVAPLAKATGVGFKELLATMSALTLGGLSTDEAATALRGTLSALAKPGTQAKKMLGALGIAHGRTQIQAVGLRKVLEQVIAANEKYPEVLDMAIPNVRAFTGLMALSSDKLAIVDKAMKQMNDDVANGTGLMESYNRLNESSSENLERISGALKHIQMNIGEELKPETRALSKMIQNLADNFTNLDSVAKKSIIFGGGAMAVSAPIAVAIGWILKVLGGAAFVAASKVVLVVGGAVMFLAYAFQKVTGYIKDFNQEFHKTIREVGFIMKHLPAMGGIGTLIEAYGQSLVDGDKANSPFNKKIAEMQTIDYGSSSASKFYGEIGITLNDPGKAVKNMSTESDAPWLNLGPNMVGAK